MTQIPKVHGADTGVDPTLMPVTQTIREQILKPIQVIPKSVSKPQRIIPPVLSRWGQGRADTRCKTTGPNWTYNTTTV